LLNLLLKKSRRPTGGTNHALFLVLVGSSFTSAAEKKYRAALRAAQISGYF